MGNCWFLKPNGVNQPVALLDKDFSSNFSAPIDLILDNDIPMDLLNSSGKTGTDVSIEFPNKRYSEVGLER